MRAIGIDPGTATTGYGVVQAGPDSLELIEFGAILTPADRSASERLQIIYRDLQQVLERLQPDVGAVEKLFFHRNVTSAMSVGQARGVAMLALADAGVSMGEYTPMQVKQAVVGYGSADKAQVQSMVRLLLGLDEVPRPDDAADALAVAICHLNSSRLMQLLGKT